MFILINKVRLNDLALTYSCTSVNNAEFSWQHEYFCVLNFQCHDKSIIIIKCDKSVVIVVLDYSDYVNKILTNFENDENLTQLEPDITHMVKLNPLR